MRRRKITREPMSHQLAEPTRRINITMLESQHDELVRRGLSISGLIRQLVEQYLSEAYLTLEVDAATRRLYDEIVDRTGATDEEIAGRLRIALGQVLDAKLAEPRALRRELKDG